jgi:general secretion pathway protein G
MQIILILSVLFLIVLPACSNKEESARKMYNEVLTLQQKNMEEEAHKLLTEIVAKYPDTQVAAEINKRFLQKKGFGKTLGNALVDQRLKLIETALDSFRLDTGHYPTTAEGLDVLVQNQSSVANWKGPYLPESSKSFLSDFRYAREKGHEYLLEFK